MPNRHKRSLRLDAGMQAEHTTVVENTPKLHNMVVCTLCSCYPWPVLGLPPVWYKSGPYRSRAVMDPRGVLREKIRLRRLQSVKKLSKGVDSFFDHISAVGRQSIARSSAGNSTVPPKKGLHQANARSRRVQSRRRPLFPEARFEELGAAGVWFPNEVTKAMPRPLLFAAVWVVGFSMIQAGSYIYNLTLLDVTDGNAPAFLLQITPDFDAWHVEQIQ